MSWYQKSSSRRTAADEIVQSHVRSLELQLLIEKKENSDHQFIVSAIEQKCLTVAVPAACCEDLLLFFVTADSNIKRLVVSVVTFSSGRL